MFPIFRKIDKACDKFVERKGCGGNDHDLPGFINPIPVDHLEYNTYESQMHQQDLRDCQLLTSVIK